MALGAWQEARNRIPVKGENEAGSRKRKKTPGVAGVVKGKEEEKTNGRTKLSLPAQYRPAMRDAQMSLPKVVVERGMKGRTRGQEEETRVMI